VELGEGVVEGEFEMGGGGVALELELEVVEMDGFDLEARESGGAGSGGWRGGGSEQGKEAGKAGGGGGEVQAVESDLTEGGAVGEEGFPVGEGGRMEGGERFGGILFAEGEVGEADLVTGEVEVAELRLELGQSALESLLKVGGALVPEVPGGE
jgi:hypothetical protein